MLGTRLVRAFARNDDGVFAVMFALMSIVLIAMGGAGVDYVLWMEARSAAQEAADAGALGASASSAVTRVDIERIADALVDKRLAMWPGVSLESASYDAAHKQVTANVRGTINPYFVQLVGVGSLPVFATSTAERATNGKLELAMVLDNTWSMSDTDGSGSTKILSLKAAARSLLDALWEEDNENIRVGLVPYAEYVNVGTVNRAQPWMSVAADTVAVKTTTTPEQPKVCETRTTNGQTCVYGAPKTCYTTTVTDGVSTTTSSDCTPKTCTPKTVAPYEYCTGPTPAKTTTTTTTTTWFGCVLSRIPRNLRLSDAEPATKYIGLMGTSQKCMTPIVPLTSNEATIRAAVNAMVVNVGTYKPSTHIPSGLVWGINLLSPSEPFVQGDAYDTPANLEPRKALILMTDGDNTLRYNSSNGQHIAITGTAAQIATYKGQVDGDTTALCTYAKSKLIEVFVVSFGVLTPASNTMLRGCATDIDHYYSAANASELDKAFENIADQLRSVRIVH